MISKPHAGRLALLACVLLLPALATASPTDGRVPEMRRLLQQVPINCSSFSDTWTPTSFACTVPPVYSAQCELAHPPSDNVHCQVYNTEKPSIRTGMTCPVKDCVTVCDLVVMQNFFSADLVFAVAELLAAWKPASPSC